MTESAQDWPSPSAPLPAAPEGPESAPGSAPAEPPGTRLSTGRWVAIGTLGCAALIASSVAMGWYSSDEVLSGCRSVGSGLVMLQHGSCLRIVDGSNLLVGGFDADGWYESFLGPGTTILVALGLAAVGVVIALRGARKPVLLVGLWLALFSWLAAAGTASVDAQLSGQLGLRVWQLASVAAAFVLGWAVVRSEPGQLGTWGAWAGLACVLALLPFAMWVYGVEDTNSFTAIPLFFG